MRSFGWGFGKSPWDLCSGPEGLAVARGRKQDRTDSGVNRASLRKGWVVGGLVERTCMWLCRRTEAYECLEGKGIVSGRCEVQWGKYSGEGGSLDDRNIKVTKGPPCMSHPCQDKSEERH